MRIQTIVWLTFLSSLAATPRPAAAEDWPQWGGHDGRNMVSVEKGLPADFVPIKSPDELKTLDPGAKANVRWVASLGGAAYGNPTVANGRVFVGTDDKLVDEDPRFTQTKGGMVKCFDEKTGKTLWQLVVPKRTGFPKEYHYGYQHLGVCSSPLVDGEYVYVVTSAAEVLCLSVQGQEGGNRGPFQDEAQYLAGAGKPPVKLKPTDADIIWRFDLMKDLGVVPHDATSCSILVHGDVLYLSTSNGVDHPHLKMIAPEVPAIIALDKRTGKYIGFENEKISSRVYHCQWSSPSKGKVGDKTLIFVGGGDGFVYAFEAMQSVPDKPTPLKLAWSADCNPPEYRLRDGKPIKYIDGDKRKKTSPNKHDGTYVGPSEVIGTPVFVNGRIYVATGQDPLHGRGKGMLTCFDATKTGDITQTGKIWSYGDIDRTICTPSIADGLVYIPDVGGRVHCVDADTGKPYWVFDTKAETWGSTFVADGKVYFGNQRELHVFAAGKELKILNKIKIPGAPIYSTPIAANGVLYVASQRYLWAVAEQK